MLSRTADHLFWRYRYTERADKRAALATQHGQPAQQARGLLSCLKKEDAC